MGFGGQYGYYTDRETGLVLMGHRYYDPGTGRFLTRDPLGYGGGMNLYGYADGNPVDEIDPDGFAPRSWLDLLLDPFGLNESVNRGQSYYNSFLAKHPTAKAVDGFMKWGAENVPVDGGGPALGTLRGLKGAAAQTTTVSSVMHTLDLSSSAWRRTKFSQEGLVYVLKDASSGEALKVGQTTAGKFVGRFEKYVTAGKRHDRKLVLEVFETPLAERGQIEGALRNTFGRAPKLPWDNAGRPPRLGRPGPGVPR